MVTQEFITQHIKKGQISIIAGRPSTGKTSLAISICINLAQNGEKTLFVSLELSAEQIKERFFNNDKIKDLEKCIKIDDTRDMSTKRDISINYLRSEIESTKANYVIIDYIQLMSSDKNELKKIFTELTRIASDNNVSILLLSQLSRHVEETNPPTLKDLLFLQECNFEGIDVVFINQYDKSGL
ncbi:MAG: AAA family ATPase [Bacteroidales bacterium]|nr:AAA family ATPase [Bacteroidales bacterium]